MTLMYAVSKKIFLPKQFDKISYFMLFLSVQKSAKAKNVETQHQMLTKDDIFNIVYEKWKTHKETSSTRWLICLFIAELWNILSWI